MTEYGRIHCLQSNVVVGVCSQQSTILFPAHKLEVCSLSKGKQEKGIITINNLLKVMTKQVGKAKYWTKLPSEDCSSGLQAYHKGRYHKIYPNET